MYTYLTDLNISSKLKSYRTINTKVIQVTLEFKVSSSALRRPVSESEEAIGGRRLCLWNFKYNIIILILLPKRAFQFIVPMEAICYSSPNLMKLYIHIIYIEVGCKLGSYILTNSKNQPIVYLATIPYIWSDPARSNLFLACTVSVKFHQDSSKTDRVVCVATDERTNGRTVIHG